MIVVGFIVGLDGEKEVNKDLILINIEEVNLIIDIDDSSGGFVFVFIGNGKFCKCYGVNFNDVNGLEIKILIYFCLLKLVFYLLFLVLVLFFLKCFKLKFYVK